MMSVRGYHECRGMFSTPEGYHEYTRECSVHWRDAKSTLVDFGTNEQSHYQISRIFVLATFATMQVYMLAYWNIRQPIKISLSGSQSPDPNTFLVSSLIKSL